MNGPGGDSVALSTEPVSSRSSDEKDPYPSSSQSPRLLDMQPIDSLESQILSSALEVVDYEVRVTVLGLAGIVVDASKLHIERKGKGKTSLKNSKLKPPTQMAGVVALSREDQEVLSVSSMSNSIDEAGAEDSGHRYVAIWPSRDAAWSTPTFKFETKLRSAESSHPVTESKPTPMSQENIDLLVALTEDSDSSKVALPIGFANLKVSQDMSKIGKHIIDLPVHPIKHQPSSESDEEPYASVIPLPVNPKIQSGQSASRRPHNRRRLKELFWKKQQGIFAANGPSMVDHKLFSEVYQTDPSGDSMLRIQLEVLHKITGGTTQKLRRMPSLENSLVTFCDKSAATLVHQNTCNNDGQDTSSIGSEGGMDFMTSVEVTTETSSDAYEARKYVDVVRIQLSSGQETIFTPESPKEGTDSERFNDLAQNRKQSSSALLDSFLPSLSFTEALPEGIHSTNEQKLSESKEDFENFDLTERYVSYSKSMKSFSDDLGDISEPVNQIQYGNNGCSALSSYVNELYKDDHTLGDSTFRGTEDGDTYYTYPGEWTLGNNTFETIGSIDFWTINGWCTVGRELLNGEIPNVYDEKSLVSGTQQDHELSRRVQGWKRHLQRMRTQVSSDALSHGSGTIDDPTFTACEQGSTGVSHERQIGRLDTDISPQREKVDYTDVQTSVSTKKSKPSINPQVEGSPLRVDEVGSIQKNETKSVPAEKQNLSQRVAAMFTCQEPPRTALHYEAYGKGEVPGMVRDIELERNNSIGEMTEITQDVALNGYGTTRLLSANNRTMNHGGPISSCLCPSHPDDSSITSLVAKTHEENENYFAEYDDYSILLPAAAEAGYSSSRAEV